MADEREQAWQAQRARFDNDTRMPEAYKSVFLDGYDAASKRAEADRLRALLGEAREALESTPCDLSGSKCAAHNYNRLPCEVAVVLAKLAQEGLS